MKSIKGTLEKKKYVVNDVGIQTSNSKVEDELWRMRI